jgi:Zn-dependent protease with chaperone function
MSHRNPLYGVTPAAWEHPADRAALHALQSVPGLDVVLKTLIGTTTERSLRLATLASSVRVSEKQFKNVFKIYREACAILDVHDVPELYVSQSPFLNAGAVGVKTPFIVLNSSTLDALSDDEIMAILGHELGHCLSGHVLYKTLLALLLKISLSVVQIPLANIALTAIIAALREWDRKSELSADRAGLLTVQNPKVCYELEMKLAGGRKIEEMDIDEFFKQAEQYESSGSMADSVYKLLNLVNQTHPFPVLRVVELKKWVDSGEYEKIVRGGFKKIDQESVEDSFKKAKDTYREDMKNSKDPLTKTVSNVVEGVSTAGDVLKSIWNSKKI